MSEPSLTESFVEVACCEADTARRYLQKCAGDMMKALTQYFSDQEKRWERGRDEPRTQPAVETAEQPPHDARQPTPRTAKPAETAASVSDEHAPAPEPAQPAGKKRPRSVYDAEAADHLDPSLPWNKVRAVNAGGSTAAPLAGEKQNFVFDSVKSKIQQTNHQGPQEGSTWHWFLVADQKVFPSDGEGSQPNTRTATTYINGDKFQAGWSKDPNEKMSEKVMATRKASMLESILDNKLNTYGKHRGGCKPGYSHRWTYADSEWGDMVQSPGSAVKTSQCFWDEQKNEDRWLVNVHMKWDLPVTCPGNTPLSPGVYVIVADQIATKMNKNQYQTSMKGRRWRVGGLDDAPEVLEASKRAVLYECLKGYYTWSPSKKLKVSPQKPQKATKESPHKTGTVVLPAKKLQ